MKTVAFLPAHPSQVWVLSQVAAELNSYARVIWYMRDKDRSAEIANALGIKFQLLSRARQGFMGNAMEMLAVTAKAVYYAKRDGIDLWVTKYGAGNIAAALLGRPSISFNDDDVDLVPLIGFTSYGLARSVLVTSVTRMGKYEKKAIRYPSFHELFYLHPNRFTPDPAIKLELGLASYEKYAVVRLSALTAHHDHGVRGIAVELMQEVIRLVGDKMRLFITSERSLDERLEKYRMPIRPERIHHALSFAEFCLGDSQTMTAEAAVLGTPAFRINDFVGRISYLDELERYGLAYGYRPGDETALLDKLASILCASDIKQAFTKKKQKMLEDKIDPAPRFAGEILKVLAGL